MEEFLKLVDKWVMQQDHHMFTTSSPSDWLEMAINNSHLLRLDILKREAWQSDFL